ncbi:MAG: hypothetical protein GY861_04735 [bacterium]|nr:hypothetical protein [bacterium]
MKLSKFLARTGKNVTGKVLETATAGVIEKEDLFGDEDMEVEEEQLAQLVFMVKQNNELIQQNDTIIGLLEKLNNLTS